MSKFRLPPAIRPPRNLSFDIKFKYKNKLPTTRTPELDVDPPKAGDTVPAVSSDVRARIDGDLDNINGNFDNPIIELGPSKPIDDIQDGDGKLRPGPPETRTIDQALNDTGKSPFKMDNKPANEVTMDELDNADNMVKNIEDLNMEAEITLGKIKRKAGLDPDVEADPAVLRRVYGDDLAVKIEAAELKVRNVKTKIGVAKSNLRMKRNKNFGVGGPNSKSNVKLDSDGKAVVTPKKNADGTDVEGGITIDQSNSKIGPDGLENRKSMLNDEANADATPEEIELEKRPGRTAERKQNAENDIEVYKKRAPDFTEKQDMAVGLEKDANGYKFSNTKAIDEMDPGTQSIWRKMCRGMGIKSKGVDAPKNRVDAPNGPKSLKSKIFKSLVLFAALGFLGFFLAKVIECMATGGLGEPSHKNMRKKGSCAEVYSVISGDGEDEDILNRSETEEGADIIRSRIKGFSGRNRDKPFMIRDYHTFGLELDDEINAPGAESGIYYRFMHYPENSYGINNYTLPIVASGNEKIISGSAVGYAVGVGSVMKCIAEFNEDTSEFDVIDNSLCPTYPPEKERPYDVDEREDKLWKTHKDGDECTLEYEVYQSAIECSLTNIIREALRDFAEFTSTALEEVGKGVGKIGGGALKGIFGALGGLFGSFGSMGMMVLYVICGLIALIILYKLYKTFKGGGGG
jgi:hypothetical protein